MQNDMKKDLTTLEYEFAMRPESQAFIPLAKAYLGVGRSVEALVICRKGIKTHPKLPTGHLIMARIYYHQAKYRKALEKLNRYLSLNPQRQDMDQLLAKIENIQVADKEGQTLLRQVLFDSQDPRPSQQRFPSSKTTSSCFKRDNEPVTVVQPNPTTILQQSRIQTKQPMLDNGQKPKTKPPTLSGRSLLEAMIVEAIAEESETTHSDRPPELPQPPELQKPPNPAVPQLEHNPPRSEQIRERMVHFMQKVLIRLKETKARSTLTKNGLMSTLYLAGILTVCMIVYTIYIWQAGLRQQEINRLIKLGRANFVQDTYAGYRQALHSYKKVLQLDQNNPEALGRVVFIGAVLTGEFGETRGTVNLAHKYLSVANQKGLSSKMLTAASALLVAYGDNKPEEATEIIKAGLKMNSDIPLFNTTMGLIRQKNADCFGAQKYLRKGAQKSDIRAWVGLAECALQQSLYGRAQQFFNRGLEINPNHVRSLLGSALVSVIRSTDKSSTKQATKLISRFLVNFRDKASQSEIDTADLLSLILMARNKKLRQQAISKMVAFLRDHPANALFHYVVAREMKYLNQLAVAKYHIQRALHLDPTRIDFALEEASIFLADKEYQTASSKALLVHDADTESGKSMLIMGDALLGEQQWDQARNYYEKCAEFDEAEAICHLHLADLYNTQPNRNLDLAQSEYELAMNRLEAQGEQRLASKAALSLAKILIEKEQIEEFFNIVQQATNIDPSYAPPYALLATHLNLSSADGRLEAQQLCGKYLQLSDRGKYQARCRKIVRR